MEQHQVGLSAWLMISTVGVSALFMGHQLLEEQKCYVILFLLFFGAVDPNCHSTYTYDGAQELKFL